MNDALRRFWLLALALLLAACSMPGGSPSPDRCEVEVLRIEKVADRPGAYDVEVRVRGEAGSAAVVSLAARGSGGDYVPGYGVEVGPGPFEAIVEQKLTARPAGLVVLLEVAGRRCKADVPRH